MNNLSMLKIRGLVISVLLLGVLVSGGFLIINKDKADLDQLLAVHFLDVGQGDAIFIETPENVQALIDGGPDVSVLRELSAVMGPFDKTIDLVVATHNDKDHIGGLIDVLERYQVSAVMRNNNQHETTTTQQFLRVVDLEGAVDIFPTAGQRYILGASTTLTVFSPAGDVSAYESNASSLVMKLEYGDTSFFFTGDAPLGIEEYLVLAYPDYLQSTVLKLGHHGSRTSSGVAFLNKVSPLYSIVSASEGNSYGHPHKEVIENVEAVRSQLITTSREGRISFYSDGKKVWQPTKK